MVNIQYYSHILLNNKYRLLFTIIIYILIYISIKNTHTAYCMMENFDVPEIAEAKTETPPVSYETLKALIDENNQLREQLAGKEEELILTRSESARVISNLASERPPGDATEAIIRAGRRHYAEKNIFQRSGFEGTFKEFKTTEDGRVAYYKQIAAEAKEEQNRLLNSQSRALAEATIATRETETLKKELEELRDKYWDMRRERDLLINDSRYRAKAIEDAAIRHSTMQHAQTKSQLFRK